MAQLMWYRYVDDYEANLIRPNNLIEPGPRLCVWYTPDRHETGAEARKSLAMAYTPTHRVGPIPEDNLPILDHQLPRIVGPANREPGGGIEAATSWPLYLFDIAPLP